MVESNFLSFRGSKEGAQLSLAKPPFLEKLESHLRQELQALDLTKGKVQELRLQVCATARRALVVVNLG